MRNVSVLKVLIIGLSVLTVTAGALAGEEGLPYHWYVNANGAEGTLDISTAAGGQVSGRLLGSPVSGWLVGRHLVLVRRGETGDETWEGWIATPEHVSATGQPVIAGTFIRPGADGPLPWFGAARPLGELAPAASPPEPAPVASPSLPAVNQPRPRAAESQAPGPRTAPRLPTGQPAIAGTWQTPDGPLEIRQQGSRLTFVLPDREVSGRLTGQDSLIGGFGPGCCKGHLEQAFTVIAWDNGVKWYRQ